MTVKELIAILETLDDDLPVCVIGTYVGDYDVVRKVDTAPAKINLRSKSHIAKWTDIDVREDDADEYPRIVRIW